MGQVQRPQGGAAAVVKMKTLVSPPHAEHLLTLESKESPRKGTEPQRHHSLSPQRAMLTPDLRRGAPRTFVDLVVLSVHLGLQHVSLYEPFHDFLK